MENSEDEPWRPLPVPPNPILPAPRSQRPEVLRTSSAGQPSGAAAGLELARAIGSLARQLSAPSLAAELAQTGFEVEPVELTLQVVASRTGGGGQSGIEWRVLSPGVQAFSSAGAVHSLKMRFSLRSLSDRGQGALGKRSDPLESSYHQAGEVSGYARQAGPEAMGVTPDDYAVSVVTAPGNDELQRAPARTGQVDDSVAVVRLCCYADRESASQDLQYGQRSPGAPAAGRLVITQEVAVVPRDQAGDLDEIIRISGKAPQRHDAKDELIDAVAEVVTGKVDNTAFNPAKRAWETEFLSPEGVSAALQQCDDWLHSLVEKPLESMGTDLGAAQPLAAAGGGVAANLLFAPVDREVQKGRLVIDVLGIAFGTLAGMPHVVVSCAHDLAGIAFHEAVDQGITTVFRGVLDGKRDAGESPSPARPAISVSTDFRLENAKTAWRLAALEPPPVRRPSGIDTPGIDTPGRGFGIG